MSSGRRQYTQSDQVALVSQVQSRCPLCSKKLFYTKKGQSHKGYELAHIYPLNPTPAEIIALEKEERICSDVNDPDNLIPLCRGCHGQFDKPRTVDEYRQLLKIKKELIRQAKQFEIQASYQLENEIRKVVAGLYADVSAAGAVDLEYDPKSLSGKLNSSMSMPTQQKIRHNVSDYYQFIKSKFLELEGESPNVSELIYSQVKVFYLSQKKLGLSQQEIFSNIVSWLQEKTKPKTVDASEIVASFFIQNCEVFE